MEIKKINDTTYEASVTLTIIRSGSTPQEAFRKLYESSFEFRMYLSRNPDVMDRFIKEHGPKTDEEKTALLQSFLGAH